MDDEYASLIEHETWRVEDLPPGAKVVGSKWVFKRKLCGRFKARLVAQGYTQKKGIDYEETFAPVSKGATLRAFLSLVAAEDLEMCALDIKTAFLYGDLDEVVYLKQPVGYEIGGRKAVCRLQQSLYGLKQSPRQWHVKLRAALLAAGFEISEGDPSLFILRDESGRVLTVVYVDDCAIAGRTVAAMQRVVAVIQHCFTAQVDSEPTRFVGFEIARDRPNRTLHLTQTGYAKKLVAQWQSHLGLRDTAKAPMATQPVLQGEELHEMHGATTGEYPALVGGLMWLANGTRPDISYSVGVLARYSKCPKEEHWQAALDVLRYVNGTAHMGLLYGRKESVSGYCDSDFARCTETRRSTTGYVFRLNGAAITWQSKLQVTCAASTCEAEYQAASTAVREGLWLRKLLPEMGCSAGTSPVRITGSDRGADTPALQMKCDNQGAVALIRNAMSTNRSKHIDIQHHFARERVARGEVVFEYCPTDKNKADCFTKPLAHHQFSTARDELGIC